MHTRLLVLAFVLASAPVRADDPKTFPAAKHKAGELRHIDGVPVLTLRGKPADMGEQFGILAIRNAPDLTTLHQQFLKDSGQEKMYPTIVKVVR